MAKTKRKIGLDYGHGADTFPPNKGVYKNGKAYHEHDFNAKLGLKLKAKLENAGYEIVEGQKAYKNETALVSRTAKYNKENVDIVVSIHANAGVKSAEGRCVFYWHTSEKGKRLAELVVDKIKESGYSTHGNGLHASKRGSWTNLHICRETKMPAILIESGFMTNDKDFELIFGDKQDKYTDDLANAYFEAIQEYFGEDSVVNPDEKVDGVVSPKPSTSKPAKPSKSVAQMAEEVIAGKHGSGHANRRKSLGISTAEYEKVRAEVNRRLGASASKPKPSKKAHKSIEQMAREVIEGKHGNGHENRRKSLGISSAQYAKVRAEVNRIASGGASKSKPKSPSKTVAQMADEVIRGLHGNGHDERRKSLGISEALYEKVRAEVNRRL